jgi:hypothetical protein
MQPEPLLDVKKRLDASKDLGLDEKTVGTDCSAALKRFFPHQTAVTLWDCEPALADDITTHLTVNGR